MSGKYRSLASIHKPSWPLAINVLLLALLAVVLVLPIVLATAEGFVDGGHFSLRWIGRTLSDGLYLRQLGNSLALACCTTALSMAIALGPAILRARFRFAGAGVLGALMLVPMILPPFVGALSMRHLLSQFGSLNLLLERIGIIDFARSLPPDWLGGGFAGVVLLQSLHLFPILYLNASAALANVDSAYQQAARNLGASSWQTFTRITLPLIRPGLFAGGTIVFIWSFTDVGTPLILNYDPLTAVTIFKEISRSETSPTVYSLVFVLLSSSVGLYVLGKYLFGRSFEAQTSKGATRSELRPLSALGTAGAWCLYGGIIAIALLPHIGVVLTAFSGRWVNTVLPDRWTLEHVAFAVTRPETVLSIKNSTMYAAASTSLDLAIGGLVAWLIVRARPRGKGLLDGLVMLPLAVPGLILAAGFVAMTAGGPLKPIGPVGAYAFVILIVAYTVRRLPFAVRGIAAGLEQVPVSLEEAARNLGAGPVTTARKVTLPLIAASAIAAGVLTFAFAVLEVSDSLVLAQTMNVYPITKEIYVQATSGNPDAANIAAALGVYGMVLLGTTLATASALLGKRLGAIFRA